MSVLSESVKEKWLYGSNLPYAEPAWARGGPSPYYRDSHRQLRRAIRAWVDKVSCSSRFGRTRVLRPSAEKSILSIAVAEPYPVRSRVGKLHITTGFPLQAGRRRWPPFAHGVWGCNRPRVCGKIPHHWRHPARGVGWLSRLYPPRRVWSRGRHRVRPLASDETNHNG